MFIGRENEIKWLQSRYTRRDAQLIVLYGRRRVGKTELLRTFAQDHPHVFYACRECSDASQLSSFTSRAIQGTAFAGIISSFADWEAAFSSMLAFPGEGKKLLIIDEFPYMVKANPSIPSLLQNLWDEKLSRENVMIILCGSAMSFMENEILAEKNPLYGRATGILKLLPMPFAETLAFFPRFSPIERIEAYACLGGIPHYLRQFDDAAGIEENIKENILTRGSILYNEVEFLMRQELREVAIYNTLLCAIAMGATRINEIHGKTQIERQKIGVYLRNLMDIHLIEREFSVGDGVKQAGNTQRGLYRITDPYFSFWYRFVFPNGSELESGDVEGVYRHIVAPNMNAFVSMTFESVCIEYMRRENQANRLPMRFSRIGRWWYKDCEIDIVATASDVDTCLLGECKWREGDIALSVFHDLQAKAERQGFSPVGWYLFSKRGFSASLVEAAMGNDSLFLVDTQRMFDEA